MQFADEGPLRARLEGTYVKAERVEFYYPEDLLDVLTPVSTGLGMFLAILERVVRGAVSELFLLTVLFVCLLFGWSPCFRRCWLFLNGCCFVVCRSWRWRQCFFFPRSPPLRAALRARDDSSFFRPRR